MEISESYEKVCDEMNKKNLYIQYKDIISYLFFGVCTTIVNVGVYWIITHFFNADIMVSTLVAWFMAVLFAYITNRKWVFYSTAHTIIDILKEMICFWGCRTATGILDWLNMLIFVNIIGFNDIIIKCLSNVAVIILNYIFSKLFIFTKKDLLSN